MNIVSFVTVHWAEILAAGTALFVAIDKIVKLTPTKVDDIFIAKVEVAIGALGVKLPA